MTCFPGKDGSMSTNDPKLAEEDGFSQGKEDGLLGRSKQPPETDPEQSSQYDLGYGEGAIQRSLTENLAPPVEPHSAEGVPDR